MALINCLECGKEISDKALACPHCGVPITSDIKIEVDKKNATVNNTLNKETNVPKNKTSAWTIFFLILLVFYVIGKFSGNDEAVTEAAPAATEEVAPAAEAMPVEDAATTNQTWSYSNDIDKMSGKESKFAYTTSTNTEQLSFPYNGGTTMDLNVRKHPRMGTNVFITVNKGQLNHEYDGNSIMVKFDDEKARRYSVNEPSDNSRDTFFISGSKKFISKLKNSKKVLVEVEFYNGGNHQFEFNTANLEWK